MCYHHELRDWEALREELAEDEPTEDVEPSRTDEDDEGPHRLPPIQPAD